ncbi:hypothetical protein GVAV_000695 [Gurleya vavrai]
MTRKRKNKRKNNKPNKKFLKLDFNNKILNENKSANNEMEKKEAINDFFDSFNSTEKIEVNKTFFDENFFEGENKKLERENNVLEEKDINVENKFKNNEDERNRIKLQKLTEKNTKLNSGYKTVKIKFDRKAVFINDDFKEITRCNKLNFVEYERCEMEKVDSNLIENIENEDFKYKGPKKEICVPFVFRKPEILIDMEFVYRPKNKKIKS